jgi:hypothetical protein
LEVLLTKADPVRGSDGGTVEANPVKLLGWRRCRSLERGCDAKASPVRGGDGVDAEADPVRGGDGFIDPFLYVSGSEPTLASIQHASKL